MPTNTYPLCPAQNYTKEGTNCAGAKVAAASEGGERGKKRGQKAFIYIYINLYE